MSQTIGEEQDKLRQWYAEWSAAHKDGLFLPETPESLLDYLVLRCCVTVGEPA